MDLFVRSIEIILANQHPSGAYVACPNFPTYQYCWFRDASFVAHAMALTGQFDSAARFHAWAARAVNERAGIVRRALERAAAGEPLDQRDILHTRLTLAGADGTEEEWANFQLDGFGTWLWALNQNRIISKKSPPPDWISAAKLAAQYLAGLWQRPNFDCWEEHAEFVHPHTLAAIYGGLKAYHSLTGDDLEGSLLACLDQIRAYIERHFIQDGHFVKFSGAPEVDASLLGLAVPYEVFPLDDPRVLATVAEIERTLRRAESGVRRYPSDTYYGGGEWVLLTAWLGWYYAGLNSPDARQKIESILAWIEKQAGADGSLPEQVPLHLNNSAYFPIWVGRWGPVATPLLWSHANYLILKIMMAG